MWAFDDAIWYDLPDAGRFLGALNSHAGFFDPARPVWVARAPGRLDLMGGIADYSGALVLELPLACAAWAAVQATEAPEFVAVSVSGDQPCFQTFKVSETSKVLAVTIPARALLPDSGPLSYEAARGLFAEEPRRSWAAYVLGALVVLDRERRLRPTGGLRFLLYSEVPPGAGVSSSAAIEVAAMIAACGEHGWDLPPLEIALLCQQVENRVAGAPCGVMDQVTAACGTESALTALLCQPAQLYPPLHLPAGLEIWGITSGLRHAVSGGDYTSVRAAAFMGYRILAECAGLACHPQAPGRVEIEDPQWQGYLANVPPSMWETSYRDRVPDTLDGASFLDRYHGATDTVAAVDPDRTYHPRACAAHPIYEHHRVRLFHALLEKPTLSEDDCLLLGELMYQSHAGYTSCGLGSEGTDDLVARVRRVGPGAGLFGAKITGGGSGGAVAVLGRAGSEPIVRQIAADYAQETGRQAQVLGGSSPGAGRFGVHRLRRVL